jgi:hypothetical protein
LSQIETVPFRELLGTSIVPGVDVAAGATFGAIF